MKNVKIDLYFYFILKKYDSREYSPHTHFFPVSFNLLHHGDKQLHSFVLNKFLYNQVMYHL